MGRPVVHWELTSKDPAKVAALYGIVKPEREGPWLEGEDRAGAMTGAIANLRCGSLVD